MATALLRQPRTKTTLARLASAYTSLDRSLKELQAIRLAEIPRNSPARERIKNAREAAKEALEQTGSAISNGSTLRRAPVRKAS